MEVVWKIIEGFPNYHISNYGDVKSIGRWIKVGGNGGERYLDESLLTKTFTKKGYFRTSLTGKDGKRYQFSVHRLVAQAFIPNPENLPQINHKDCDKINNFFENLEWCNNSHNQLHAYANGLNIPRIGELNGRSKLSEIDVLNIREIYSSGKLTQKEIAEIYPITQTQVSAICSGEMWVDSAIGLVYKPNKQKYSTKNINETMLKRLSGNFKNAPTPIIQFNSETKETIGVYLSVNAASKASGIKRRSLDGFINKLVYEKIDVGFYRGFNWGILTIEQAKEIFLIKSRTNKIEENEKKIA